MELDYSREIKRDNCNYHRHRGDMIVARRNYHSRPKVSFFLHPSPLARPRSSIEHLFHRRPFARLREAGTSVDSSRPPFRRHRLIIGFDRAAPTLRVCHSSRRDPELSKLPRAWMSETREASDDETSETTDRPTAIKIFNYRDVISLGTGRMVVRSTPEKLERLESRK